MPRVMVFAGTTDGLFVLESDGRRSRWRQRGPFLRGHSVNHFGWDTKSQTLYAATLDEGVLASRTFGRSWQPLNDGLSIRKVWTVAVNPKDSDELWAGTHFSYLFRSTNRGHTWSVVPGYVKAPGKEGRYGDWGWGTIGNCLHTILMDPKKPKRIYAVSSSDAGGNGALRSDDGGETWQPIRKGTFESCPEVTEAGHRPGASSSEHLANEHTCTHRLAFAPVDPQVLYRQMHCGVYRSSDYGASWMDISKGLANRHGFPLAVHPRETDTLFVVSAFQGKCKKHNSCIQGTLQVHRSRTSGHQWEVLHDGLPDNVHCVVLRHGMDVDRLRPAGVYLGTTTGQIYGSANEGDSWARLASQLPRVQGIVTAVV